VKSIFEARKPSEEINYIPFKKLHNKFLLWFGVKPTSVVATMREGIRIPSED
jgi:hypothetical protein